MGRTAKRGEALLDDPEVIFQAAELFLQGETTGNIAAKINRLKAIKAEKGLSREQIYPLIRKAYAQNLLELHPPVSQELRDQLADRFGIRASPDSKFGKKEITVVHASVTDADRNVAHEAARIALDHAVAIRNARRAGSREDIVTLGLGPGQATLDFARYFGRLLETRADPPSFRLLSLTAGCPGNKPHLAATSMFNLLPEELVAEQYGMFAGNLVSAKAFPHVAQLPGVRESFTMKSKVDLVVTSMGDFDDPYDLLRQHLASAGVTAEELRTEDNERYIGNVQYRPYTRKGFVRNEALRAVTLFELEELVSIAGSPQKAVILIARRRGYDGRTRSEALRPLLENPEMQLFSHLIIDEVTARELLRPER